MVDIIDIVDSSHGRLYNPYYNVNENANVNVVPIEVIVIITNRINLWKHFALLTPQLTLPIQSSMQPSNVLTFICDVNIPLIREDIELMLSTINRNRENNNNQIQNGFPNIKIGIENITRNYNEHLNGKDDDRAIDDYYVRYYDVRNRVVNGQYRLSTKLDANDYLDNNRHDIDDNIEGDSYPRLIWHIEESMYIYPDSISKIRQHCHLEANSNSKNNNNMLDLVCGFGHIGHATESALRYAMSDLVISSQLWKDKKVFFGLQKDGDVVLDYLAKSYGQVKNYPEVLIWKSSFDATLNSTARQHHSINFEIPLMIPNHPHPNETTDTENVVPKISVELQLLGDLDDMLAWHATAITCSKNVNTTALIGLVACQARVYRVLILYSYQRGFYNNRTLSDWSMRMMSSFLDATHVVAGFRDVLRVNKMESYVGLYYKEYVPQQDVVRDLPDQSDTSIQLQSSNALLDESYTIDGDMPSWTLRTNLYFINQIHCPAYMNRVVTNWVEYVRFPLSHIFYVDEIRYDQVFVVMADISHVSALHHCVQSDQDFCIVIEDGLTAIDEASIAKDLDDIFSWSGGVFDIFFLHTSDSKSSLRSVHWNENSAVEDSSEDILESSTDTSSSNKTHPLTSHGKNNALRNCGMKFCRGVPRMSEWKHSLLPPRIATNGYIVSRTFAAILLKTCLKSVLLQNMGWPPMYYSFGVVLHRLLTQDSSIIVMAHRGPKFTTQSISVFCGHQSTFSLYNSWRRGNQGLIPILPRVVSPVANDEIGSIGAATRQLAVVLSGNLGTQLWTVFSAKSVAVLLNATITIFLNDSRSDAYARHLFPISEIDPHLSLRSLSEYNEKKYTTLMVSSWKNLCRANIAHNLPEELSLKIIFSSNGNRARFKGIVPQYLPLSIIQPYLVPLLRRPVDKEEADYLQMIYWNIHGLAAGKPTIIVCLDDWEGTGATSSTATDKSKGNGDIAVSTHYVRLAMLAVLREYQSEAFFVFFAKDLTAARDSFGIYPNTCFLGLETMPDYFTLKLMALFDGAILSNSKFSWWAGYLIDSKYALGQKQSSELLDPVMFHDIDSNEGVRDHTIINRPHVIVVPRQARARCHPSSIYPPSWMMI